MRIKCLSCHALTRMVYLCAAESPHIVDVELFRIGLHNEPLTLRARLQERIDAVSSEEYDAIVLAYGLCGQATAELKARAIPLVLPRTHDCIALFLGDRARYQAEFQNHPGTYWYALDYVQRRESVGTTLSLGSGMDTGNMETLYDEYVEKYGQDNADYLMEVMGAWQTHYDRAVYIDTGVGDGSVIELQTKDEASRRGWTFERMSGDVGLIRRLLNGDWEDDFLVLQPGQKIGMAYDEGVVQEETYEPSEP